MSSPIQIQGIRGPSVVGESASALELLSGSPVDTGLNLLGTKQDMVARDQIISLANTMADWMRDSMRRLLANF